MLLKSYKNRKEKVPREFYSAVHYWLKKKYGIATKCENKECTKKSQNYQWAKKTNKSYDFKRANFFQLCRSCHGKYDTTAETRQRMRELNPRTAQTHCKRGHIFSGENIYYYKGERNCRTCRRDTNRKYAGEWQRKNPEKTREYHRERYRRENNVSPDKYRKLS